MSRMFIATLAVLLALSVSGCATPGFTFRLDIDPRVEELSSPARAPLHAGVYYSPEFSGHEVARIVGTHTWIAPIGQASVKLFDGLLPRAFERTSPVTSLSPEEIAAKGVDVVVAPTIEHFDFKVGIVPDSARHSVVYRITLYDRRAVPAASWTVAGDMQPTPKIMTISPSAALAGVIEADLKDAAVKFVDGFARNAEPAIRAIQARQHVQPASLDTRQVVLSAKRSELPGLDAASAAKLRDAGIVVIEVSGNNANPRPLLVRASDMRLRLPDGLMVGPEPLSSVLSLLDSKQDSETAFLLGGPILALAANTSELNDAQAQREQQLRGGKGALFNERSLAGGKAETGLVVFRLPKGVKLSPAALTAWVVDLQAADGAQLEIGLHAP